MFEKDAVSSSFVEYLLFVHFNDGVNELCKGKKIITDKLLSMLQSLSNAFISA